jgi:hypothetical protein
MQISVIAVSLAEARKSAKGTSYSMRELTYKVDGQTKTKKLMSFDKPVYDIFKEAQQGEVYEVEQVKDGDFWMWTKVTKLDGTTAAPKASGGNSSTPARTGTWETPEERAVKQVYIARSVALGQAVALRPKATDEEVLTLANKFEQWLLAPQHGLPPSLEDNNNDHEEDTEIS